MRIKTIEQLYQAAVDRRCVTIGMIHGKPTPAAWVINLQGSLLRNLFRDGIYLYKPKSPTIHFNCCYNRVPCGRHTGRKTPDKSKVTCIACRRTVAYTTKK
jgi:hypothetical protein